MSTEHSEQASAPSAAAAPAAPAAETKTAAAPKPEEAEEKAGTGAEASGSEDEEEEEDNTPARQLYDEAKREAALKHWSEAADKLARVLEKLQEQEGIEEDAPLLAPILHRYGKAVLNSAVANSAALGGSGGESAPKAPKAPKAGGSKKSADGKAAAPLDPRFSFAGDAESGDEDEEEEDEGKGAAAGEDEDDDDFGLAFSVLDLARVIYEKLLSADNSKLTTYEGDVLTTLQIKAQLAETYNDLGDVGLETENFSQASSDYEQSLRILRPLLRPYSRRLADAQLRLGLALEFHPDNDERPKALMHVTSASNTLQRRLIALDEREKALQSGEAAPAEEAPKADNGKGKGKATAADEEEEMLEVDDVASIAELSQLEKERKDVKEMIEELALKLEEYKHVGNDSLIGVAGGVDKEALKQVLNDAFVGASTNAVFPGANPTASDKPVNDLSSMVKKKKPVPAAAAPADDKGKRKLEDEPAAAEPAPAAQEDESSAKRVKVA